MLITACEKQQDNANNTVKDGVGNVYHIVAVGTQEWMTENLKVTHYRNGDPIPNEIDFTEWKNLTKGAYCWYDNDEAANKDTYGALYNSFLFTDSRNICPAGWHVPTDEECTTLTEYLGGVDAAGGKLKESGTEHWDLPNAGDTNETNFAALPGGYRSASTETFEYKGQ
ncbi:MAG: fibrobacter succinogenes major paralogous domain-containing protein [Bacteroidales bacterium]|nr:fibrobacter succinogenes major paralogous domain-containing protein [Bacteroidales bacterium]